MRRTAFFPISDVKAFKRALCRWTETFPVGLYLDSNSASSKADDSRKQSSAEPYWRQFRWECLAAVGVVSAVCAKSGSAFSQLRHFYEQHNDWIFGFLSYDLKNEVERLHSKHPDHLSFPDLYFFCPQVVVGIRASERMQVEIHALELSPAVLLKDILQCASLSNSSNSSRDIFLHPRMHRMKYLDAVAALREHIAAGDVYEVNLCQEFYAEEVKLDPVAVFERLKARTRAPFSAFLRWHDRYLICASPERFLAKRKERLFSQPMKGTRPRVSELQADLCIREMLRYSEKDRAENAMIVDLVRNDLARHCTPGSVVVEELFGVYTFETVHQMISTISGSLAPTEHPISALRDAFPMGSMTGAPKIRAMELIEQYECARRGLYSGSVGYFSPDRDFDFNVVIRSILYRADVGYVSCQVGSAIVYDSGAQQEYEECLIKLEALQRSLLS
ncbi:MAG: anthranilate synthase component I family protein [Saprospiraceae bacterium]|nr:anthranilate synthase component I family protein [Saprospiraceae bacterium]MDW8483394.1 anthranilate synthase component I family protein [Saprospiraceae bacterium]